MDAGGGHNEGIPLPALSAIHSRPLFSQISPAACGAVCGLSGPKSGIGDAILELLGPVSPESPLLQRPTGLVSMASWEVANMQEAIQHARQACFTVPDPAPGPLPGTRITTIQGAELAGVNMQLLEYV